MRNIITLSVLITFGFTSISSCKGKNERSAQPLSPLSSPSQEKSYEEKARDREIRNIAEVNIFRHIENRLRGTTLKRLNYEELPTNAKEIRIWDSNSFKLYCVILKEIDGEWMGWYLPPVEEDSHQTSAPIPLPPPKDGWKILLEKLESLDIYTIPDAEDVGANIYGFDLGGFMCEIKTSKSYRNYMYMGYRASTKPEAEKVADIVDTLLEEFSLKPFN